MRGVAKALANTQTEEPYGVREAGPNAALDKGTRSNGDSNQPSSKRTVHTGSSQRPPRTHEERHKSKPILLKRPPAKPEKGKMNIDMRSGSEEEIKEAQLVVPTAPLTDKLADTCTRTGTPEIMSVYAHASDKERPATSAPGVGRKRTAENVNPHLYSPRVEQQAAAHNHQPELVDGRAWLNASINPSSCPADAHAHARDTEIDDGHHASSQPDIDVSTAKPAATAIEADRAGAPASEYDTMTDVQSVKAFISILRNREPCNAGTSTGTQATVKAGRMALARLLNTPILDLRDFASDCLEIVESIQFATPRQIEFKRPIGDKHLLQAISLAVNVVRATPSTIDRAMLVCIRALLADPSKALAKRARFGIRCLIDDHGLLGHAAFKVVAARLADAGGGHAHGVIQAMSEWHRLADIKLERLPLPAAEWLNAMKHEHDISIAAPARHASTNIDKGVAIWMPHHNTLPAIEPKLGDIQFVTWNANSFFKRLRDGNFATMLLDHPDLEVIHITELRKAIKPADEIELRGTLEALGFTHILWNWCADDPGNYGSAILSKLAFEGTIGLEESGDIDPEGRTITTHFQNFSQVWTYTPCSSMFSRLRERDERRITYDEHFLQHCKRTKAKIGTLFVSGDMNVAPCWGDTTVPAENAEWYPSNKSFERDAYFKLLKECKLENMAEALEPHRDPDRTWEKGQPGAPNYIAMRLDHVLGPGERILDTPAVTECHAACSVQTREEQPQPKVTKLAVGSNKYKSDHYPVFYTISYGTPPSAGASAAASAAMCEGEHTTSIPAPSLDSIILDAIRRLQSKANGPCRLTTPAPHQHAFILPTFHTPSAKREFSNCIHEIMAIVPKENEIAAPSAATRAFSQSSTKPNYMYPEYTPYRGHGLPHEHCKVVPEASLLFGEGITQTKVKSMFDTGACYNIMTEALARKQGLRVTHDQQLPLLELADGTITSPLGTTSALVRFGPGKVMRVQFFVFKGAPYEAIFGSDFMTMTAADISFPTKSISLEIGGLGRASFSFKSTLAAKLSTAAALLATGPTMVPAHSEMKVPVRFATPRRDLPSQWGVIEDAQLQHCKVARGLTCAVRGLAQHYGYHCKVINASDKPIHIDQAKPIAFFRPIDTSEYAIIDGTGLGESIPQSADINTASCSASSAPISTVNIDKEWASHPHLADLDLSMAKRELNTSQFDMLRMLILKHHDLWDTRPKEPPEEADVCSIRLEGDFSHFVRTRPMGPNERNQLREIVDGQLLRRIIEPSKSPYASAIILVPKKGGGIRFCVDYRALNSKVRADSWTLPNVEESMTSLHGNSYFTSLDMKEAFWSVPLDEESRQYTAFQTPDGLMQYRRVPMGLKTASAVFCRYVDRILGSMKWTSVLAYVDDLLIFSKTFEEHLGAIGDLLGRLGKYRMTLGAKKCTFFANSVGFLGHIIDRNGVRPDPIKTRAIEELALPTCVKDMQSALGLMQYYRKFVANFSKIAQPLRAKQNKPSAWRKSKSNGHVTYTEEELKAWETLKGALTSSPILGHPDWNAPFQLHTDASYTGLGAALVQVIDGKEHVIQYASRSLAAAENNYAVWELECLAVVWATRLFRMYLQCSKFTVFTDSIAAKRIIGSPAPDSGGRIMRWALSLQDFDFTIEHRKASRNGNADGLSRLPLKETEPYNEGPTIIEPLTMFALDASPNLKPAAITSALAGFQGCAPFFPPHDNEAHTATDFAKLQAADAWCVRQAAHACSSNVEAKPGHTFRDDSRGGLLLRKSTSATAQDQVLVPLSLRAFILRRYHGLPVSAHLGRRRTYAHIKRSYYWPGMSRDVGRWIAACLACRKRKTPRPLSVGHPGAVSNATRPWEKVSIDVVSVGVTSKGSYTKILTILDLFTRYVMAIPLRSADAPEIGDALFEHLFCRFGKPSHIHSDAGREFVNKALVATYKLWGISFSDTGGYQPQANPVERFHRFMNSSMTIVSKHFGKDWPSYLPAVCFAYNASTNDATGFTPYELIFNGEKPTLLHQIDAIVHSSDDLQPARPPDEVAYHVQGAAKLKAAYIFVREQQEKLAQTNREAILRRRGANRKQGGQPKLQEYNIGDMVLFWEPSQPKVMQTPEQRLKSLMVVKAPRKWKDSWSGPHDIVGKKPDATGFRYEIYHKKRGTKLETHVNKLCRFQPWSAGINSTSDDIDNKALYKCGEWVPDGALVIVPLERPYPFGVAKLLKCDAAGDMTLQWLGNDADSANRDFTLGWKPHSRSKSKAYYNPTARHSRDKPYTTQDDGITMNQRDVLMHSFELTTNSRLPAPLIRAIARHPYVWWDPAAQKE